AAERYIRRSSRPDRFLLLGLRRDMPAFYAACTTVALSSRSEAFPLVLGEAMATGVPCVSTDVGDARRIIGDTGFVVPPEDPDALADGLHRMLALDSETYRDLASRAVHRIRERFSVQRCVEDYQRLFREMVHGVPTAASAPDEPAPVALDLAPARAASRRARLRRAIAGRAEAPDASA
ncbi:MAG: glycosyltransferase, partial [Gemmatimonadota bacterium]|nr:glycosyltransferase [Gemmatimonadota bacterium]